MAASGLQEAVALAREQGSASAFSEFIAASTVVSNCLLASQPLPSASPPPPPPPPPPSPQRSPPPPSPSPSPLRLPPPSPRSSLPSSSPSPSPSPSPLATTAFEFSSSVASGDADAAASALVQAAGQGGDVTELGLAVSEAAKADPEVTIDALARALAESEDSGDVEAVADVLAEAAQEGGDEAGVAVTEAIATLASAGTSGGAWAAVAVLKGLEAGGKVANATAQAVGEAYSLGNGLDVAEALGAALSAAEVNGDREAEAVGAAVASALASTDPKQAEAFSAALHSFARLGMCADIANVLSYARTEASISGDAKLVAEVVSTGTARCLYPVCNPATTPSDCCGAVASGEGCGCTKTG
ncbi:hypothetical protein PLESTM_002034600 [Pleodorina starrii]|nr:hypothetical protein PLESTM_002034600 [Pleodorina starrii]